MKHDSKDERLSFVKIYLFYVCGCFACMHVCAHKGQKRVSDFLQLELQMAVKSLCDCWKLNVGPLQKQKVL